METILIIGIALMSVIHIITIFRKNKRIDNLEFTIYERDDELINRQSSYNLMEDEFRKTVDSLRSALKKSDWADIKQLRYDKNQLQTQIRGFKNTIDKQMTKKNYIKNMLTDDQLKEYQAFKRALRTTK